MGSFKLVRHFAGTRSPPRSLDVVKRIRCVAFGAKLVHEASLARNRHGKTAGNCGLADLQSLESSKENGLHRSPVYLHKWILSQVCLEGFVTCCLRRYLISPNRAWQRSILIFFSVASCVCKYCRSLLIKPDEMILF